MSVAYRDRLADVTQATSFAVLGDTQRTMAYQLLMGREWNNHPERVRLVEHITRRSPACLVIAGELPSNPRDFRRAEGGIRAVAAKPVAATPAPAPPRPVRPPNRCLTPPKCSLPAPITSPTLAE